MKEYKTKDEINYREIKVKCCGNCNHREEDYENIGCRFLVSYIEDNYICDLYDNSI